MRRFARIVTGTAVVVVVAGAPLPAPPPALAQESFDIELRDLAAWAEDSTSVAFEVSIEAIGDEGSPPGEVVVRWEDVEVGRWPLEAREYAAGAEPFTRVVSLTDEWAGSTGWFEVSVSIPGDWDAGNDRVGMLVDLPVTLQPGDVFEAQPPPEPAEEPDRRDPAPGDDGGFDPTWVLLGGGAAGALVAGELMRRRQWRRRRQEDASDRRLEGPCQPGAVRTIRSCRPKPRLRKVTGLQVSGVAGGRPVAADLSRSQARRALAGALRHRRRGHDRRLARKLDEASAGFAEEIASLVGTGGGDVDLAGSYEGGKMKCTFEHRKCGRGGTWPGKLVKKWTATVRDEETVAIGQVAVVAGGRVGELAAAVRPLLANFLERVDETSHPAPASIGVSVRL